ncbi:hypothetical protein GGX14DRAFT_555401 [Mycena pura]|uniref:Immunoreactive mannoprotein MP88 n=1 Tax=Mycena pura TaxID=153505 RepID=A0AAD7E496_9AGAR|nr:hypothetical protein GGX14DRAFT_555401 [Mycena pura]
MVFFVLLLASSVLAIARAVSFPAGVIATGTQGVTNPPVPTMPTTINQTSMARLLSLNSIDDFCLFAPPSLASIPDTETEEVAWCTMPRNNARVIPDGTFSGLSFLKTDFYVQIMGTGNLTNLNIAPHDDGGELDPHGATGAGNPIGGNVTTTVANGIDEPIAEWMLYISDTEFCIRACYFANETYPAKFMCWHELDVMGCEFVMPGTYNPPGTFETCDADVAYPPGWYPTVNANGQTSFSTFAQFFTGVFTGGNGQPTPYTVGDTVTPTAPAFIPSSSNCVTQATISNGIAPALLTANAVGTAPPPGFSTSVAASGAASGSASASTPAGSESAGGSGSAGAGASNTATPTNKGTGGASAGAGSSSGAAPTGSSPARRGARVGHGSDGEFAAIALLSLVSGLAAIVLLH